MQTSYIDDIDQFYELKETWDAIYLADPYATVFVSWTWLRGWFEGTSDDWFVLAVRPDNASPYVAFLPLFVNRGTRGRIYRGTLRLGGDPWTDHAGLVCLPSYEEETIDILAEITQK